MYLLRRRHSHLSRRTMLHLATTLSDATAQEGCKAVKEALERLDQVDYVSLLTECGDSKVLRDGKAVHAHAAKAGVDQMLSVGNAIVQMYGNCGSVVDARQAFDRIREKNVVSWNIMITAYAQNGHLQEARNLFDEMCLRSVVSWNAMIGAYASKGHEKEALKVFHLMDLEGEKPTKVTFLCMLDATASLSDGKLLHARIVEAGFHSEVTVGTSLVKLYGRFGNVEQARDVFEKVPQKNVVSWTAMLGAYTQNGHLQDARRHFDEMPVRNVVSWNVLIGGYTQSGHSKDALKLFRMMDIEGVQPDKITFAAIVDACADLAALAEGKIIHAAIAQRGFLSDHAVGNALLNMYGRCGRMEIARHLFDGMKQQSSTIPWTTMVGNYARNGYAKQAIELFHTMGLEGMHPSQVLFITLLSVCSHGGMLVDGRGFFVSMVEDYGIVPVADHYMCMVDLLGRTGKLDEAQDLIKSMPCQAEVVAWKTLLGACKSHGDVERGRAAANQALQLDQATTSPYVMLSNMYRMQAAEESTIYTTKNNKKIGQVYAGLEEVLCYQVTQ